MRPGGKEGPHAKTAYRSVHTGSLLCGTVQPGRCAARSGRHGACSPARCPRLCSPPTPEGLAGLARTDESGFISAALAHYAQLGLAFDCVYSGYLAGAAQVALVEQAFRQAPAALKLVDPVMADHGRPYASMTPEIRAAVAQLCGQADVIVPNATEAALHLEELPGRRADGTAPPPRHAPFWLQRLSRAAAAPV